jgi:hypothetical protein
MPRVTIEPEQPGAKRIKDFPPRQKAASFTIEQANDKVTAAGGGR